MHREANREGLQRFRTAQRNPPGHVPTLAQLQRSAPGKWCWVYCAANGCLHHAPMAIAPFVIRWGPEAPATCCAVPPVARNAGPRARRSCFQAGLARRSASRLFRLNQPLGLEGACHYQARHNPTVAKSHGNHQVIVQDAPRVFGKEKCVNSPVSARGINISLKPGFSRNSTLSRHSLLLISIVSFRVCCRN